MPNAQTYIDMVHLRMNDKKRLSTDGVSDDPARGLAEGDETHQEAEEEVEKLKELARQPDIVDRLVKALAPSIWELEDVKRGLLAQVPKPFVTSSTNVTTAKCSAMFMSQSSTLYGRT